MRSHSVLLGATVSLALALGLVPMAAADDAAEQKAEVEQQLTAAQGAVEESTAEVAAAAAALRDVDGQLAAARTVLAAAQDELDIAKAEDVRLAGELTAALAEETAAEARLVEIQAEVEEGRAVMAGLARSTYQGGQLAQMSALLTAESFVEYSERSEAMRSVLHAQGAAVSAVTDARAQQSSTQALLEAVRERVAVARADAAANLVEKERLEQEAAAATAEVERLHAAREAVLADAQATLAADEAEQRALQAEHTRLEQLLAERARAQAAAAAAAAAEAAANAAAEARAESPADDPPSAPSTPDSEGYSGTLYRPVSGWVTSPYGWRIHPISGVQKFHNGTDFGSPCGTPIRAAESGTVLSAYYAGGYGNQTVIEHGSINGTYVSTSYNHQSGYAVSAGDHVDRGEVIGYVGTTGYSTGCHLHFIVYENGSTTDPMNYL